MILPILEIIGTCLGGAAALIFISLSSRDRQVLLAKPQTIRHKNSTRTYRLFIPKDLSKIDKVIFAFHGNGGNARQMAYITGLHNSTDERTVVVYPEASDPKPGQKRGWNAGFCCGSGYVNKVDDVGFIRDLRKSLQALFELNELSFYAVGFSNGGMFVNRLAAENPELFDGFASFSGSIGTRKNTLRASGPAPILLVHGAVDTIVPFAGGAGSSSTLFEWLSFEQSKAFWKKANGGAAAIEKTGKGYTRTTYAKHRDPLEIIVYPDMGHRWPDWRLAKPWHRRTDGTYQVLRFFESL